MARSVVQSKLSTFAKPNRSLCTATIAAILMVCVWFTVSDYWPNFSTMKYNLNTDEAPRGAHSLKTIKEPSDVTFYDDHETIYTIDKSMVDWDTKRTEWLKHHMDFMFEKENRVLVITGSQPSICRHPKGDRLLLRLFKNKVDYCRRHGYEIFYNNALLDPKMSFYWAKIPIVRAAMVAHPDVEWIFWVDSDAVFTDMEFKIPLTKYKNHNFVIPGKPNFYFEKKKSWLAINAGVFLIRNCQWSMNFLDVWANFGPISPNYTKWGEFLKSIFEDKYFSDSDDQSALTYLLLKERKKWGDKIYIENDYALSGYWLEIVKKYDNITEKYLDIEKRVSALRRRHAEAVSESYATLMEEYVAEGDEKRGGWRRPFITHFTGCQPCNGDHNPMYPGDSCLVGLDRTLNFADNQVLRNYGFMRPDIGNDLHLEPVPFDFPGDEI